MVRTYHFHINGRPAGPLGEAAIRGLVERGEITPETLAWCEGMSAWEPAAHIAELTGLFGEVRARTAQPPPLPGEPPPGMPPPPPGAGNGVPAGLSPLEARAYRFVMALFRDWGTRPTPVRAYVQRNPRRAVPVAAASLVVLALILASLPSLVESPDEPPSAPPQQTAQGQIPEPPANWREGYRAWQDAQRYGQGVTDEVIRGSQSSWDRQSDSYNCGAYGRCGDNN